jgi:hypothetical protein
MACAPSSEIEKKGDCLMKNIVSGALLAGALLCAGALAQDATPASPSASTPPAQSEAQPQPSQQPEPQAVPVPNSAAREANQGQAAGGTRIAPGSVIPVQLIRTIDAKKAKPGDEVVARVTMDLKTTSGEVVVPKDTKVVGHVTEAQARNKEQKESQVAIAFDRAVLKGADVSLPMSIQAVIAPPGSNANNGSNDQGASSPPTSSASASPAGNGRSGSGSMGGAGQSQPSTNATPNAAGAEGTPAPKEANARPQITGNTQGVVGISSLKLEPAKTAAQGSVLSSEKNNVKVESGTMLLLKVNQ